MRFVAIVFMVMVAGLASASEPEAVDRQALVVAVPSPGGGVPPLVQAEAHALRTAEVLQAEAGFERVATLVGNRSPPRTLSQDWKHPSPRPVMMASCWSSSLHAVPVETSETQHCSLAVPPLLIPPPRDCRLMRWRALCGHELPNRVWW